MAKTNDSGGIDMSEKLTHCLKCGSPGEDIVFKFLCTNQECNDYRVDAMGGEKFARTDGEVVLEVVLEAVPEVVLTEEQRIADASILARHNAKIIRESFAKYSQDCKKARQEFRKIESEDMKKMGLKIEDSCTPTIGRGEDIELKFDKIKSTCLSIDEQNELQRDWLRSDFDKNQSIFADYIRARVSDEYLPDEWKPLLGLSGGRDGCPEDAPRREDSINKESSAECEDYSCDPEILTLIDAAMENASRDLFVEALQKIIPLSPQDEVNIKKLEAPRRIGNRTEFKMLEGRTTYIPSTNEFLPTFHEDPDASGGDVSESEPGPAYCLDKKKLRGDIRIDRVTFAQTRENILL